MRKIERALTVADVPDALKKALREFFTELGRDVPEINDETDLMGSTGATSDEGVDFAIDLCDILGVEVPNDFNPFVHESGRRGMRFHELVDRSKAFFPGAEENDHVR